MAFNKAEHLPAMLIQPQIAGAAGESFSLQMLQQLVNCGTGGVRGRPADGIPDPHNGGIYITTGQFDFSC
jgi:hypothetical protein